MGRLRAPKREPQGQESRDDGSWSVLHTVHFHNGNSLSWLLEAARVGRESLVYYVGLISQGVNHVSAFLAKRVGRHYIRKLDRNAAAGEMGLRQIRLPAGPSREKEDTGQEQAQRSRQGHRLDEPAPNKNTALLLIPNRPLLGERRKDPVLDFRRELKRVSRFPERAGQRLRDLSLCA